MAAPTSRMRRLVGKAARPLFERGLVSDWSGPPIGLNYWDGRRTEVGSGAAVAEVEFRCPSVFADMLISRSIGFGNAYADGRLDIDGDLQAVLRSVFSGSLLTGAPGAPWLLHRLRYPIQSLLRLRATANARFHYDLGNEFFGKWLDSTMTYSCAYFQDEHDDLESAQRGKLDLICRKLSLQPDLRLLDVGCGWGSLLFHAIEHYGVHGVGVTPSREQAAWIRDEAKRRGISSQLELQVADWKSIRGSYDRVVSVGMFEHVGKAYGRSFLDHWRRWLKPQGVSVLHSIGAMTSCPPDPWIEQNIFPGGYLPSLSEIVNHVSRSGLMIADVENLWRHYAITLQHWADNFAEAWRPLRRMTDERFMRTWWLYLNASQAAFASGRCQLWQVVITRDKLAPLPLTREGWLAGERKPRLRDRVEGEEPAGVHARS
ncbi:MAG: cyclopropane-fatty-acyl-phospholipid synthase family protein [Pirellulaceae bacterium]